LTKAGKWKTAKSKGKYLFNVKAMSITFRGKFIAALKEQLPEEMTAQLVNALYKVRHRPTRLATAVLAP
jgi:hypothetical protein